MVVVRHEVRGAGRGCARKHGQFLRVCFLEKREGAGLAILFEKESFLGETRKSMARLVRDDYWYQDEIGSAGELARTIRGDGGLLSRQGRGEQGQRDD